MENETLLSTNRLFHYTSSKEKLISILNNGFQPRFSLEKLGIIKNDDFFDSLAKAFNLKIPKENITDEFAIPMCCFCDIPLNLVNNLIKVYGKYSIGLKKEWGENQAICPVIYLPDYGATRVLFNILIRNYNLNIRKLHEIRHIKHNENHFNEKQLFNNIIIFYDTIVDLTMFVKPYSGPYERKNYKTENYKFYDEREWRYKPDKSLCKSYMTKQEFESYKSDDEMNINMGYINFEVTDISDIIVPKNEVCEIRELVTKIPRFKDLDIEIIDSLNKI